MLVMGGLRGFHVLMPLWEQMSNQLLHVVSNWLLKNHIHCYFFLSQFYVWFLKVTQQLFQSFLTALESSAQIGWSPIHLFHTNWIKAHLIIIFSLTNAHKTAGRLGNAQKRNLALNRYPILNFKCPRELSHWNTIACIQPTRVMT